ncbi:MAG: type II secretion system protein, partial [Patescibacteria group bacterium]|nr:type II secretion system protein [Patescibacteria group bacterium]
MKYSNLKAKIKNFLRLVFHVKHNAFNFKSGQSIVELLITIGLSGILLPALITGLVSTRQARPQQDQRLLAIGYLREGQEAVRAVREDGWANFAVDGTYHPVMTANGDWSLVTGQELINGFNFTRQIVISDVSRDSNGNIVATGGTNDPSTKKVVTTVSWTNPLTSSVTATSYFTRYANL